MSDISIPFHPLPVNPYWPVTVEDACGMIRVGLARCSDADLANPDYKAWTSDNLLRDAIAKFGLNGGNTPLLYALGGAEIPADDAARILIRRTMEMCIGPDGVPPMRVHERIRFRHLFRHHALENANHLVWEIACAVHASRLENIRELRDETADWIHLVMPTAFPVDRDRIGIMLADFIPMLDRIDWQLIPAYLLHAMGDHEYAQIPARAVIARNPAIKDAWEILMQSLYRRQEYPEMIEVLIAALIAHPDDARYWSMLGLAYYAVDMWHEALDAYEHAIAINPDSHPAWNNKGEALLRINRLPEAIACFEKSASIRPDDPEQYRLRGDAYFRLGHYSVACTNYAIAAGMNDGLAKIYSEFVGSRLRNPIDSGNPGSGQSGTGQPGDSATHTQRSGTIGPNPGLSVSSN